MNEEKPWRRAAALSLALLTILSGCASKPPLTAPVVQCPRFQPSTDPSTPVEPESLPSVDALMNSLRDMQRSLTALQQSLSEPAAPTETASH